MPLSNTPTVPHFGTETEKYLSAFSQHGILWGLGQGHSGACDTVLQWRHNECNDVSNHQPHECLLKRLFSRRSKKTPKLRVTGLCEGNSPVTGEFPAQRASNAENVSIWWRHHGSAMVIQLYCINLRYCNMQHILYINVFANCTDLYNRSNAAQAQHDDVIKWKHFPRYWAFVRGSHRSPVQRPVARSFDVLFDLRLNKQLNRQSWGWWFETP